MARYWSKNKWPILGGIVILIIGLIVLTDWGTPEPPAYSGKSLKEWLKQGYEALSEGDREAQVASEEAVRALGKEAIPYLRFQLTYRPDLLSRGRRFVKWVAVDLAGQKHGLPERNYRRRYGEFGFKALGRQGVSTLVDILQRGHREARGAAINCLEDIGPAAESAVPVLGKVLRRDPMTINRMRAASALREIGSTEKIVTALLDGLKDEDPRVRTMSALGLGRLDTTALDGGAIAELAFGNFRGSNIVKAAKSNGDIHPSAGRAVPLLKQMSQEDEVSVRNAARFALEQIDSRQRGTDRVED